jgi:uncharacterized protein with GYD domain
MAKYAFIGGYTSETWARWVQNPGDRMAAVEKLAESVGAKIDQMYWSFGEDDFLVIADAPDDVAAAAIAVAVGSSGALRNTRTIKLLTSAEVDQVLHKAKAAAGTYVPPGAREAVHA